MPVVFISVPLNCNADVAFMFAPCTVPDAVIVVAPAIAPVFVIPPALLLIPPVIDAPPALIVIPFAELKIPVPVVEILPVVDTAPSSVIVSFVFPPDWTRRALPVDPATTSLMISAGATPAFVSVNEVDVARLDPRVKSIFLPDVVSIVFPLS